MDDQKQLPDTQQTGPTRRGGPGFSAQAAATITKHQFAMQWASAFAKVGGPISFVICILLVTTYRPSPSRALPLMWNIAIFVGTIVFIVALSGLGALFGYGLWSLGYRKPVQRASSASEAPVAPTDRPAELPQPDDPSLLDYTKLLCARGYRVSHEGSRLAITRPDGVIAYAYSLDHVRRLATDAAAKQDDHA